jgi:cell division protein FtsB
VNVDLGIWARLTRLVTGLLLLAGLVAVVVWYYPLLKQNERMRKELQNLDAKIKHELEVGRNMKASIDSMRDPRTVERLAREKLSYARTGETVFRFEAPTTNAPAPRP